MSKPAPVSPVREAMPMPVNGRKDLGLGMPDGGRVTNASAPVALLLELKEWSGAEERAAWSMVCVWPRLAKNRRAKIAVVAGSRRGVMRGSVG